MIRIINASTMKLDQVGPYMSGILREMGRLAKRFPKDVTTEALFGAFLKGEKTLWLILDDDRLLSIAMTTVKVIDGTGTRVATLLDLAGRDVRTYAAELCSTLEQWAAEQNCQELAVEGREGWNPLLKQSGYRPHAILYRKTRAA